MKLILTLFMAFLSIVFLKGVNEHYCMDPPNRINNTIGSNETRERVTSQIPNPRSNIYPMTSFTHCTIHTESILFISSIKVYFMTFSDSNKKSHKEIIIKIEQILNKVFSTYNENPVDVVFEAAKSLVHMISRYIIAFDLYCTCKCMLSVDDIDNKIHNIFEVIRSRHVERSFIESYLMMIFQGLNEKTMILINRNRSYHLLELTIFNLLWCFGRPEDMIETISMLNYYFNNLYPKDKLDIYHSVIIDPIIRYCGTKKYNYNAISYHVKRLMREEILLHVGNTITSNSPIFTILKILVDNLESLNIGTIEIFTVYGMRGDSSKIYSWDSILNTNELCSTDNSCGINPTFSMKLNEGIFLPAYANIDSERLVPSTDVIQRLYSYIKESNNLEDRPYIVCPLMKVSKANYDTSVITIYINVNHSSFETQNLLVCTRCSEQGNICKILLHGNECVVLPDEEINHSSDNLYSPVLHETDDSTQSTVSDTSYMDDEKRGLHFYYTPDTIKNITKEFDALVSSYYALSSKDKFFDYFDDDAFNHDSHFIYLITFLDNFL